MHEGSNETAAGTAADVPGPTPPRGKPVWRTPTVEELPFTSTEAGGVGAVYDFVVYAGST